MRLRFLLSLILAVITLELDASPLLPTCFQAAHQNYIGTSTRIDMSPEEFSKQQSINRRRFKDTFLPRMQKPNRYHSLPSGIHPRFLEATHLLWKFHHDGVQVFELLGKIEAEVFLFHREHNTDLETALEHVLRKYEKVFGFSEPIIVTAFLPNHEFLGHLFHKRPIYDSFYKDGHPHTIQGHRIIAVADGLYLQRFAQPGGPSVSDVYQFYGDINQLASLNWSNTGLDLSSPVAPDELNLFGYRYDQPFWSVTHKNVADDVTNPLFLSELKAVLPGLGWR